MVTRVERLALAACELRDTLGIIQELAHLAIMDNEHDSIDAVVRLGFLLQGIIDVSIGEYDAAKEKLPTVTLTIGQIEKKNRLDRRYH